MQKWFKALSLGLEILNDLVKLQSGEAVEMEVSWKGKKYWLTLVEEK